MALVEKLISDLDKPRSEVVIDRYGDGSQQHVYAKPHDGVRGDRHQHQRCFCTAAGNHDARDTVHVFVFYNFHVDDFEHCDDDQHDANNFARPGRRVPLR